VSRRRGSSNPPPPGSDPAIWLDLYIVCLPVVADFCTGRYLDAEEAAQHADAALAEYRKRFLQTSAPSIPMADTESTTQPKGGIQ